jgi:hypothetical protein
VSLVNPDELSLATVSCTSCDVTITNPTSAEHFAFSAAHIHGNATLQAWFDKRARAEQAKIIDDLQKELFSYKAEARSALALLEVLPHAVANGRTAVVNEYLDRVTGHVSKMVKS